MKKFLPFLGIGLLVGLLGGPSAFGDADGARKAIAQAKGHIEQASYDQAETDLKLAEAELDGVTGADKEAVIKAIAETRASIGGTQQKAAHDVSVKKFDYILSEAKKSVGSAADFAIVQKDYERAMAGDEAKALSAEERAAYDKQFAPVKKIATGAAADANFKAAEQGLGKLEQDSAAVLAGIGKTADNTDLQNKIRDYEGLLTNVEARVKELPADDARTQTVSARYKKVADAYAAANGASEAEAFAMDVWRDWERQAEEMAGWEKETTGPTMAAYLKDNKGPRDVNPKTVAVIQNADRWLKEVQRLSNYDAVKAAAPVKTLVDSVVKQRDAAREKIAKFIGAMLDEGDKMQLDSTQALQVGSLFPKNEMVFSIGEDAPQLAKLQEHAKAIGDKAAGAVAAGQKAVEDLKQKMTEMANAAWPKIAGSLSAEEISDASGLSGQKGKVVHLKRNNRSGWDYSAEYAFAAAVNGFPIVGKFAPNVEAAFKEVSAKVGGEQQFGDDEWEVIGEVVGPGKVNARLSADVRDRSGSNVGTVEGKETRDCTVLNIIALKAGPLCVGPSGMVNESGSTVIPVGAAGSFAGRSGGSWGMRLLMLVVGLTAAGVCLLKAGYAPLTAMPQAGQVQARLGGQNLAYIGLACAAIGVLFLLQGMVIYGLLVNAAIIAAGAYAAIDFLAARSVVKPELLAKVRPLGVPTGFACAVAVIVHLLLGIIGVSLLII